MTSSRTTHTIAAAPRAVFDAFTNPRLLVLWQAPDNMTARIHRHDIRPGGGYEMSLYYHDSTSTGKSGAYEDRYTATFLVLDPPYRIVESIEFASDDPDVRHPMTMTVELEPDGSATRVTLTFDNLPAGVSAEDNHEGARQSLAKLSRLLAPHSH